MGDVFEYRKNYYVKDKTEQLKLMQKTGQEIL